MSHDAQHLIAESGRVDRRAVETGIFDCQSRAIRQRLGQTKIDLSEHARLCRGAEKKRAQRLSPHQERHRDERGDTSDPECLHVFGALSNGLDVL